mmetsp:Transcript_10972/g.40861  ORF Transcript_10972/g.40861 Transcript_10972/m.40861 type:complete len:420 (-) Transcript_10972:529-1788(-)|eukprot:CAMPEP_0117441848 /NCGR_PEP_ID=MMETSP0759-20121206/3845_1 /TAXON_ID=63605 /ORGANISM="Percolomonas cosmopolitus, Strain WS" /LENGTH=419 /DNA_ID=CAMNT_0005233713 /DNA_START=101 /DNA_END=1360 /DNA_ORIENTATION=-
MQTLTLLSVLVLLVSAISAKVYFHEEFKAYPNGWVESTASTGKTLGKFILSAGEFHGNAENQGLKTSEDYRHYAIAKEFDELFSNEGKDLILQYTVKNEQGIDCGGQYVKIGPKESIDDMSQFNSDAPYSIMFGPDICGATKKVHFIFSYKGKNLDWKKNVVPETDKLTHIYTAIVHPDNTYEVQVDGVKKESGKLEEDWDFLPPKIIPDPEDKKPADWVDEPKIADPEDKKPSDWDNEPKFIADPDAAKPEDWDDEEDGEWEAPQIPNPNYKGEWSPRMIDNPAYKGEWKAKMIDNPDYQPDDKLYKYDNLNWAGFELWQVKAGTIFDNILVSDSVDDAKAEADRILADMKVEKAQFDAAEAEKRRAEEEARKQREEEERKRKEEEDKKTSENAEKEEAKKEAAEATTTDENSAHDEL